MNKVPQDCIYTSCGIKGKKNCGEFCQRYIQTQSLINLSNLPADLQKIKKIAPTCPDDEKAFERLAEIKGKMTEFVEKGSNLYICSEYTGTGKTTWATNLMLKYFTQSWERSYGETKGLFISVPRFIEDLRRRIDDSGEEALRYIDYIKSADLVIWDDIGFNKTTDYQREQLMLFIDSRITDGKSNIYTSNIYSYEALANKVGDRVASRAYKSSEVIRLYGKDFREYIGRKNRV